EEAVGVPRTPPTLLEVSVHLLDPPAVELGRTGMRRLEAGVQRREREPAARPQHPTHGGKRAVEVVEVAEGEVGGDAGEGPARPPADTGRGARAGRLHG